MIETTQTLASRWKRLGGVLLDSLLSLIITLPVMVAAGVFQQIKEGRQLSLGQSVYFFIFGQIIFLVLNGFLLARHGQTIGKRIVGTRIVGEQTGQMLRLGQVYGLRYLTVSLIAQIPVAGGLFGLIDSLFIFRSDKRCVHDLIAGTIVIDAG